MLNFKTKFFCNKSLRMHHRAPPISKFSWGEPPQTLLNTRRLRRPHPPKSVKSLHIVTPLGTPLGRLMCRYTREELQPHISDKTRPVSCKIGSLTFLWSSFRKCKKLQAKYLVFRLGCPRLAVWLAKGSFTAITSLAMKDPLWLMAQLKVQ